MKKALILFVNIMLWVILLIGILVCYDKISDLEKQSEKSKNSDMKLQNNDYKLSNEVQDEQLHRAKMKVEIDSVLDTYGAKDRRLERKLLRLENYITDELSYIDSVLAITPEVQKLREDISVDDTEGPSMLEEQIAKHTETLNALAKEDTFLLKLLHKHASSKKVGKRGKLHDPEMKSAIEPHK